MPFDDVFFFNFFSNLPRHSGPPHRKANSTVLFIHFFFGFFVLCEETRGNSAFESEFHATREELGTLNLLASLVQKYKN